MFIWLAGQFLHTCYLAGPGTHPERIKTMAATMRSMAWAFFFAGALVGGIGGWLLTALLMS